jgi:gamma-glutamyltranspeptidase/glutathione hydrolase
MRAKEWPRLSHPLASLAAIETLKAGGTAADACDRGRSRCCAWSSPAMTGIGGDCFCLVAKPDQPVWGYNGSGPRGRRGDDREDAGRRREAQDRRDRRRMP